MDVKNYRYDGSQELSLKKAPTSAKGLGLQRQEIEEKTQRNMEKIAKLQGKLYAQGGKVLDGDLTPEQIIGMDWLAENIMGSIPDYDQLNETAKATVDLVGVEAASKDKRG